MEEAQNDAERFSKFLEYKAKGLNGGGVCLIRVPEGMKYQTEDWSGFLFLPQGGDRWYTYHEYCEIKQIIGGTRATVYMPEQRPET